MAGDQHHAESPDRSLDRSISRYALPAGSNRVVFSYEHAGLEQLHSINYRAAICALKNRCRPAASTR
jgi:hypothetical protein